MLMLLFCVGNERYACDCESIVEVLPRVLLKNVQQGPNYLAGLLNYGGHTVPVIDLCRFFEKRPAEEFMHTRIIIISGTKEGKSGMEFGLLAEKVTETREIDPTHFMQSGVIIDGLPYINGVLNDSEGMIRLLEIDKLVLSLKETFIKVGQAVK